MAKISPKKMQKHFWNEESGLTSMFILLCISNFLIIPFFTHESKIIFFLIRIFWFFLLITGITTLAKTRKEKVIFSVIPILLLAGSIFSAISDDPLISYFEFIVGISVFALLIGMVIVKVFENGSVTIHRVIGSILAYMLIGNVWAQIYQFIYIHVPGSLQISDSLSVSGVPSSVFLYFSYTTLTTTGFGDIIPVHTIARTMAIIEQLIGVLYPVVLIGRLVSLVSGSSGTADKTPKSPRGDF
jgi:hypothetical protein